MMDVPARDLGQLIGDTLALLETHADSAGSWLDAYRTLKADWDSGDAERIKDARHFIRMTLQGGMGSFSNVVLYRGGRVDVEASSELERLRESMFDIVLYRKADES